MSNTPKVRFAGAAGDWEQRKLGDLLRTIPFKPYLKATEQDGQYEIIQQGNAPIIGYANGKPCEDYKNTVIFGDHTLSLYKPKQPFFVATDGVRILQGVNQMDGNYLLSLLERNRPQSEGYKRYYSILADREVFFTGNIDEQAQIGLYFNQLDNLITLHQRKYDKLIVLKSACLDKMFPKNGSKVPELRFAGFAGEWEQCKLGDLLRTIPFKPYLKATEQDGKYEIIQQGNDPIIGYANGKPCEDYKNTVIFGDHTLSLYKPKQPFFVATDGVRILQGVNEMDGNFLFSLLERNRPQSEGYKRYYSILADREAYFTSNIDEQTKIGLYFNQLDNLITLHQRKIEKLQQFKQAMMYNMIV